MDCVRSYFLQNLHFSGPNQQIKPHPTRWHYPLITYLNIQPDMEEDKEVTQSDVTPVTHLDVTHLASSQLEVIWG